MQYKFTGNGAGIPGLPHLISQEEIDQLGPDQVKTWKAALESGSYVEVEEHVVADPSTALPSLESVTVVVWSGG